VPIILQGVSIADPEHLERKRGAGSAGKIFDEAAAFGANVIRVPIHKGEAKGWGLSRGVELYLDNYVDPLVRRAEDLGIYIIIDFHLIADYLPERDLALQFWQSASQRYGNTPNAIFELFNEPILPDSWAIWKREFVMPLMSVIRANAPQTLVIVGSPHWSGHIRDALFDPVTTGPVAYTAHIYPEIPGAEIRYNYHEVAGRLPLFVTEWGFNEQSEYPLRGTRAEFGDPTVRWMNDHSISWTAWIYDNTWGQSMFDASWHLRGGDDFMGELVREQLQLGVPTRPQ
jgi:aryl-phospho-beta-D-glucosidase BglC (GH1 family)